MEKKSRPHKIGFFDPFKGDRKQSGEWFRVAVIILLCGFLGCCYLWVISYQRNAEYHRFEYHDGLILDTKTGALYEDDAEYEGRKTTPHKVFLFQEPVLK